MGETKVCKRCGEDRPLSDFSKQRGSKDGLRYICRKCNSEDCKDRRALADPELRERQRQEHASYLLQRRATDPEYVRACSESSRRWAEKNSERMKESSRNSYLRNRDKQLEAGRKRYEANKTAILACRAAWKRRNMDRVLASNAKRHALKRGSKSADLVSRKAIIARDNSICYLCGKWVSDTDMALDHVVPVTRGGPHTEGNLRVTHQSCNLRKGRRLLSELSWYQVEESTE